MVVYYELTFLVSVICLISFFFMKNRNVSVMYGYIMILATISNMGALYRSLATTLEMAIFANALSYVGGCFLPVCILFCTLSLCRIEISKKWKVIAVIPGFLLYIIVLMDNKLHWLYKSANLTSWDNISIIEKEYGPAHTCFYALIIIYTLITFAVLWIGYTRRKEASVKNISLIFMLEFITVAVYFIQRFLPAAIQLTSVSYVFAQVVILVILQRLSLYDVDGTVIDAILNAGEMGCLLFTQNGKYLGCNAQAAEWFPQMKELKVDRELPVDENELYVKLDEWINSARKSNTNQDFYYKKGDYIYKIEVGLLYRKLKAICIRFTITDYTDEQKYKDLLTQYNDDLKREVAKNVKHIEEMQNRLVLGMADMVENRDNSTGGHIKRTSKIVEILVSAIKEENELGLSDEFCDALIKAAPMHDLGKIAVDDDILRKPGKFTDEEFAIMKTHAEKGAAIVRNLLQNIDDDYFAEIAENVAHYHHERVDGTGYPKGLRSEEIPIEARIMAIADVYDALVSKRCYKESMSFEEAYNIIEDGMGKQFDQRLEKYFIASRTKLEEFYYNELN